MKIYTSYYGKIKILAKANIIPIGISVGIPRYFTGYTLNELAPRYDMLKLSESDYRKEFAQILAHLNARQIIEKIQIFAKDLDVALLCWERPGLFCHRTLVAAWLTKETGIELSEFEG